MERWLNDVKIRSVHAREILDSRGKPTIQTCVALENGIMAEASVPSGASTGAYEACEKRDGGARYHGNGVMNAVNCVNVEIADAIIGVDVRDQIEIDGRMIRIDGSERKTVLGANAMLSASFACARCASKALGLPLYRYLGGIPDGRMPRVMMNVLNGGAHAGNNLDIQEFMLVPKEGVSTKEAVRMCSEIYAELRGHIKKMGLLSGIGDEGGFAPDLETDEEALMLLMKASESAGYAPGSDVFFALDVASSAWAKDGKYVLPKRGKTLSASEMIQYIESLINTYPIISVEDPLGEDDFEAFSSLTDKEGAKCMIVGDDLFVTNPERIRKGTLQKSANAVLIKPNQIGTVTETLMAVRTAKDAGMRVIASHRSGETADTFLSDLSVGFKADFIKSGSCKGGKNRKIQSSYGNIGSL